MQRLIWIGLALTALGVLTHRDDDDADTGLVATPFMLGLAIEIAAYVLRNTQGNLLSKSRT